MDIKVVTYNILSRNLCNTKKYSLDHYVKEHIDNDYRYNKLLEAFRSFIKDSYIICLQEVDKVTSCKLQIFFRSKGYDFYYDPYGDYYNGYMGVAIALPSRLKVNRVEKYRLSDGKYWPREERPQLKYTLLSWVSIGYINYNTDYKIWRNARAKRNTMISLEIEDTDRNKYCISTLHMPCSFKNPSIMTTYVGLVKHRSKLFADGLPYIIAGDFNITPNSQLYKSLTDKVMCISSLLEDYNPVDKWNPNELNLDKLDSAHAVYFGREPEYTCNTINSDIESGVEFKDTLDYILYKGLRVLNAGTIHTKSPNVMPNQHNPSDHIPVFAYFVKLSPAGDIKSSSVGSIKSMINDLIEPTDDDLDDDEYMITLKFELKYPRNEDLLLSSGRDELGDIKDEINDYFTERMIICNDINIDIVHNNINIKFKELPDHQDELIKDILGYLNENCKPSMFTL